MLPNNVPTTSHNINAYHTYDLQHNSTATTFSFFNDVVPTPFPFDPKDYAAPPVAMTVAVAASIAFVANLALLSYILWHRLYNNFVSSHFIAHLCITNALALAILTPMIVYSLWTGTSLWIKNNGMCRIQAFLTCSSWSVVHYMILCIAGVQLLTFARIHYDQLFGLPPLKLCALAWTVAFAVALPCITNGHIVVYDPILRTCIWGRSDSSYKFFTYFIILGVIFPVIFIYYAYFRVLIILYHTPIVFQSIGLYKSRFLVYAFLCGPLYQVPFYGLTLMGTWRFAPTAIIPLFSTALCFMQIFLSPLLYGLSLIHMKEEDMALTARAQKA